MIRFIQLIARPFFIFGLFTILIFFYLPFTFFQQDEWAIFGNYLYWEKANLSWFNRLFTYEQDTHLIPLANLFSYIQFKLFQLNFTPYALVSLLLHIVNAFLVYRIAVMLTSNKKTGFVSGLLFLVNAPSQQAVTWVATSPGTVTAALFTLLSFYFLLQKKVVLSIFSLIVSLGFKETSLFLFLYLPLVAFFLKDATHAIRIRSIVVLISIVFIVYACIRVLFLLISPPSSAQPAEISQTSIPVYIFRSITLPLKSIPQTLIPQPYILSLSDTLVTTAYPQFRSGTVADPYVVQSIGADIVSYTIAGLLLTPIVFIVRKEKKFTKLIGITVSFIVVSTLPLILIPGKAGYFSLFDGRHLYIVNGGVSLLVGVLSVFIIKAFSNFFKSILGAVLVIYLLIQAALIHQHLQSQVEIGRIRKSLLTQISAWYPTFPEKTLVYTESDTAYYGLPESETILPFQSGFGNTLLVWYDRQGDTFPACFFEKKYLYVLLSQDYKECEGRGFGYFRKLEDLNLTLEKYGLKPDNMRAFSFQKEGNKLTNIPYEKISPRVD